MAVGALDQFCGNGHGLKPELSPRSRSSCARHRGRRKLLLATNPPDTESARSARRMASARVRPPMSRLGDADAGHDAVFNAPSAKPISADAIRQQRLRSDKRRMKAKIARRSSRTIQGRLGAGILDWEISRHRFESGFRGRRSAKSAALRTIARHAAAWVWAHRRRRSGAARTCAVVDLGAVGAAIGVAGMLTRCRSAPKSCDRLQAQVIQPDSGAYARE